MALLAPLYRLFEGWIDPFEPVADTTPPPRLVPFVWHYVRQAKWAFVAMLIYGFVNALVEAALFTFVGRIVDIMGALEAGGGKGGGWSALLESHGNELLFILAVVAVGRGLVILFGALVEEQVIVPGFYTRVRWQANRHVIRQSLSFFQDDLSGRIAQKVIQSGQAMGDMMLSALQIIWFIIVYAATTTGLLAALDWRLGAVVLAWVAVFALIARHYIPRIREEGRRTAEAMSSVTGRLVDGYANIATVKLHANGAGEERFIEEAMRAQHAQLMRFTRLLTGVRVALSSVSGLLIAAIGALAVHLWLTDRATPGEVAFALALVLRLNLLLGRLMGNLNGFFRSVGTTQNAMDTIARPIELTDRPSAPALVQGRGDIRFEHVTFGYGGGEPVIRDLTLHVRPGERVGLVGPSGAGKTTLVNLLLRFHDPQSGRILLDGQDIAGVTQESLRASFAVVGQETALFQRSVRDNIAYGRAGASLADVEAAAARARADGFIARLADGKGRRGYEARVGERGVKLSGGQRQRIAIARLFLRDSPVLILDEATSALDSEVEAAIQDNLAELMEGRTVIAIAHRLSTIASLDRLVVIDDGRIVEDGSHDELLAREGGLYAALWTRQSGGFLTRPEPRGEPDEETPARRSA